MGPMGVPGASGSQGYQEEFVPAAAATTITLAVVPDAIIVVARDGVVQSELGGNYSAADDVLTFSDAFTGSERVIVGYLSGAVGASVDSDARAYVAHLMSFLDPTGPPPPVAVLRDDIDTAAVDYELRAYLQHVMAIIDPSGPPSPTP